MSRDEAAHRNRRGHGLAHGLGLLMLVLVTWLQAQDGEPARGLESLRPTGPVTIEADQAEWEKGGAMVYSGNVRLLSGELVLQGERLQLRQFEDGEFEAQVEGGPALLDHAGLAPEQGQARQPVSARARALTFDTRIDIVQLTGDALLTRGSDQIRGQSIRYDVSNRRIRAQGGEGGQVRIVIQPPPPRDGERQSIELPNPGSGGDGGDAVPRP